MTNKSELSFQVILITWKRKELLRKCLSSLREAGIDLSFQLILVINGRDLDTVEMLESEFSELGYQQINQTSPSSARNFALKSCNTTWAYFIDDDSWVEKDYFSKACNYLEALNTAAVFGGPDFTPQDSSLFQKAIGKTLTSPLATASTRYRHSNNDSSSSNPIPCNEKKLILCNLWINTEILKKHELEFPSELGRNEENLLLYQLEKRGEKLYYIKDLSVFHQRSKDIKSVFQKAWLSGFYRMKSFLAEPSSIEFIFFIPAIFILYLISIPLICSVFYTAPLALYVTLVLYFSIRKGSLSSPLELGMIALLHLVINLAYGLGSLSGLIKKEAY